jgi:uncharacterized membrane protein YedE/YeeE
MQRLTSLLAGLLFGAGLAVSGMIDPARVQGFLDLFGNWDPTLAFVMGGAMIPMAIAWRIKARMESPLTASNFNLPDTLQIDRKLATGAVLFGLGWGISGLCPGPALADLAVAPMPASIFVAAMIAGMGLHRVTSSKASNA